MSNSMPIGSNNVTAPTPQNTPLQHAPISAGLSRPTVPDINEDREEEEELDGAEEAADIMRSDAMLGLVQGRLASLVGRSSGYVESLPDDVKRSVEGLKGIQVQHNDLHNQYKRECLELEKKYNDLYTPLYERRSAIISGKEKPTEAEIEAGEKQSAEDDDEYSPLAKDGPAASAIPEFWLTALRNHIGISDLITERDSVALKHLTDIRLTYLEPLSDPSVKPGFKITFFFTANEYFDNETLEKTYYYQEKAGYFGDMAYDHAVGTDIKWKEDKDLTKEFEIKKQRNKTTNRTRVVRKARPTESFFNFFNPPISPDDDAIERGEIDDEELEELEEKIEMDYQIGEDLKEKVIPHAIDYFTGKALEYDLMDEDDDEDDDDFEDEDDDGFEDDDSDGDVAPPKRRAPKGRGGGGDKVNPEECKNQ
ncbi:NAP-domain-containing protein [Cylindrobasidium torrendii FP15055 ss-10]|uniref:NAP-domain-containing protein n=1 Tax=Cylindrobasidium torrendii FP15055 ss-10 TaxID=1314674 RepID=A0A0D7BQT2_9AGAR|nr:NAP-domain-containing protein [Cylindrobasidium torrendii FP15055 ss-10]